MGQSKKEFQDQRVREIIKEEREAREQDRATREEARHYFNTILESFTLIKDNKTKTK